MVKHRTYRALNKDGMYERYYLCMAWHKINQKSLLIEATSNKLKQWLNKVI